MECAALVAYRGDQDRRAHRSSVFSSETARRPSSCPVRAGRLQSTLSSHPQSLLVCLQSHSFPRSPLSTMLLPQAKSTSAENSGSAPSVFNVMLSRLITRTSPVPTSLLSFSRNTPLSSIRSPAHLRFRPSSSMSSTPVWIWRISRLLERRWSSV